MDAHSYLRKIGACVQVAAQHRIIPATVTFPRRPRSTVDYAYELASDYGDAVLLSYRLSHNDEPELWPVVAALQPELGTCLALYREMVAAEWAAESQASRRARAFAALEARTSHGAVTPAVTAD